jgi:hypothetical protein
MKINNECHHHAKYLWCKRCSIHILNIIYFLQIVTNHNTSFILEEKIVRIRFISEYSFQWYQFIIVSLIDDLSRSFRLNNVVFHLRNFQKFFNMRMSQHNSSMQRRFRQIADVKFRRRCRFYYEFWRFRIESDHHCCVKYENSRYFFVCSSRVRKIFRRSSNSFLLDNVDHINARVISFEISTFKNAFSVSKRSFDKFDEWKQRKLFFRKEKLFSLFNDLIFRKNEITFLFFIETFRLDISIVTKMLIVDADSSSNDDVSSDVNNWKISIDDEISFFIVDFETIFFRELFNTCFRIDILSYCFSSLFSNICNEIARYVI